MEAVLLHQLQISEPPSWGADSLDEHLVCEWEPFPPPSTDVWSIQLLQAAAQLDSSAWVGLTLPIYIHAKVHSKNPLVKLDMLLILESDQVMGG